MPRRLNSLQDVRRMLSSIANDLNEDKMPESKARCLTYVLSQLAICIKDSDLEQRIEKLEKQVQEQKTNGN